MYIKLKFMGSFRLILTSSDRRHYSGSLLQELGLTSLTVLLGWVSNFVPPVSISFSMDVTPY